eukprot:scaffold2462_cov402-Prasinococcus_capsulatus_cf.AAC.26
MNRIPRRACGSTPSLAVSAVGHRHPRGGGGLAGRSASAWSVERQRAMMETLATNGPPSAHGGRRCEQAARAAGPRISPPAAAAFYRESSCGTPRRATWCRWLPPVVLEPATPTALAGRTCVARGRWPRDDTKVALWSPRSPRDGAEVPEAAGQKMWSARRCVSAVARLH